MKTTKIPLLGWWQFFQIILSVFSEESNKILLQWPLSDVWVTYIKCDTMEMEAVKNF